MWWIWVIVALIVVTVIIIVAVNMRKKPRDSGIDEMKRGFERYHQDMEERTSETDLRIEESTRKTKVLNVKAQKIANERLEDHEKLRGAGDWDKLDDVARDIEKRR